MQDSLVAQASNGQLRTHEMMDPLRRMGRIGRPEEVAELIAWLCSNRAGFVTGPNITIYGGYVAH